MQDISTQRSAWSTAIVITPGQQYKRDLLAAIERASHAQLLQMLKLSPDASRAEFDEVFLKWRSGLDFMAEMMDITETTTPEGALAEVERLRDRAMQRRAMQAEIHRIEAEMAANEEK